jgi:LysM repeat protein
MRFKFAPRGAGRSLALAVAATIFGSAAPARASVPHLVQPGETLWGISAANNFSTASVAAFNGLSEESYLVAGETIQIPSADEGASALAGAGGTAVPVPAATAYGLATISGPYGSVQLDPAAAASWEAMRADALAQFGIDLFPDGSLSGYRTYEQQAYLYDLFLAGAGAPANPPGSSSHELGIAVDVAEPVMRDVIDQIGAAHGWYGIASEWWHVEYSGG